MYNPCTLHVYTWRLFISIFFFNYRLQQNGHKYAHTVLHMQTNNAEGSDIMQCEDQYLIWTLYCTLILLQLWAINSARQHF